MHTTLPTAPGAILGYRRNGTPIRLAAGGSSPAEPAAPPADPPAPAAPADPAQQPAPTPAGPAAPPATAPADGTPAPQAADGTIENLPPWAQKLIRDTRSEAAAGRTKAKQLEDAQATAATERQSQMDRLAEALGLKTAELTPEQIAAQRDAAQATADAERARARAAAVELAVFRAAAQTQVNGNALLDSRAFVAGLDGLDPSDAGFGQQVQDKIAAACDANPGWKLAAPVPQAAQQPPPLAAPAPLAPQVPASSPAQSGFGQPPAGPRQLTAEDATRMSPQAVVKAMNEGLFADEGFGASRASQR